MEPIRIENESKVVSFYTGKNILITGATGFMGKVLIEKLLRTCKGVGRIYLMVRQKKGKTIEQRTQTLFGEELFSRLKQECPSFLDKVTIIPGDVSEATLGLNEKDRERLIDDVDIVFHAAATVNFDEKIKMSVNINIRGTQQILHLCRQFKHLKAVIHISTAYGNCNRREVEEQIYESKMPSEAILQMTQIMDDEFLDSVTPQIIKGWPNTYTFTKQVAEDCVQHFGKGLPVAIFRPSIIIGSSEEPVPGWIDNLYGPTGVCVAVGAGIMRTSLTDPTKVADIIPVDYCVNAMISLAWDVATNRNEDSLDIPVYNYVSSCDNPITWGDYVHYNMKYGTAMPCSRAIWYYTLTMTKSRFLFAILSSFFHTLPAMLMDLALVATNHKRRMMTAYVKIHKFLEVIAFFSTKQWKFTNNNVRALWDKMSPADREAFKFDMSTLDWQSMLKENVAGVRKYLLKDPPTTIPAARRRMFLLHILHRVLQLVLIGLFVWMVYGLSRYLSHHTTSFESTVSNKDTVQLIAARFSR
ncbi:unnamed protein product [Bemisia tabaci]|uniref:Fatty acyl-CoA reductase n=1 Tax=Bemisia tabaci TaxID=7038 RepID=A0A9P0ADM9_BEMTA|nr:unnamed protein product [Bemisia tabaci]